MFIFKVDNQTIDINPNVSIRITISNPMFWQGEMKGTVSYPFKIPASEKNKLIFGFPHRIEKRSAFRKNQKCTVEYNGTIFLAGEIVITEANNTEYSVIIISGTSELGGFYENKYLNEIDLGNNNSFFNYTQNPNLRYPDVNFAMPTIYNTDYFKDNPKEGDRYQIYPVFHNYYNNGWGTQLNTPCPYLAYLLDMLLYKANYKIMRNDIKDNSILKNLILFTCMHTEGLNLRPKVLVNFFLIDLKDKFGLVCFVDNSNRRAHLILLQNIIKGLGVVEFSEGCEEYEKLDIEDKTRGYLFTENINSNDSYFKPTIIADLEQYYKGSVSNLSNLPVASVNNVGDIYWVTGEQYYYQCVSEDTNGESIYKWIDKFSSFQTELKNSYGDLNITTNITTLLDDNYEDPLTGEYEMYDFDVVTDNITTTVGINDLSISAEFTFQVIIKDPPDEDQEELSRAAIRDLLVEQINNNDDFFAIAYSYPETDGMFKIIHKRRGPAIEIDYEENIESTKTNDGVYSRILTGARTELGRGIEMPITLLFYNGLQKSYIKNGFGAIEESTEYAWGSNIEKDSGIMLQWGGQNGLVNTYWNEYIAWYLNTRKVVTFKKWLKPYELTELKLWKRYRIHNQNYFIESIDFTISQNKLQISTLNMLKA